jgi:hypothetical protein
LSCTCRRFCEKAQCKHLVAVCKIAKRDLRGLCLSIPKTIRSRNRQVRKRKLSDNSFESDVDLESTKECTEIEQNVNNETNNDEPAVRAGEVQVFVPPTPVKRGRRRRRSIRVYCNPY